MTLPWRRGPLQPVPPRPARSFACPEPGCPFRDNDPDVTLLHAFSEHPTAGRERRSPSRPFVAVS